ncbi:hypothetical protein Ciccas_011803 [Cichlidogyrus casuarinus]|uniref:Uncharacterized protein n=1 Tax=Cichlidogyrus casuarinus TaxID=1844966 RepID=A0ABD2PRJ4_9PLAT
MYDVADVYKSSPGISDMENASQSSSSYRERVSSFDSTRFYTNQFEDVKTKNRRSSTMADVFSSTMSRFRRSILQQQQHYATYDNDSGDKHESIYNESTSSIQTGADSVIHSITDWPELASNESNQRLHVNPTIIS